MAFFDDVTLVKDEYPTEPAPDTCTTGSQTSPVELPPCCYDADLPELPPLPPLQYSTATQSGWDLGAVAVVIASLAVGFAVGRGSSVCNIRMCMPDAGL
jgi:hypothetical protein